MIYLPDYNISAEDIVQGFEINDREYRRGNKNEQSRNAGNIGDTRHRTLKNTKLKR
jgi:hypothetical protein